MSRVFFLLFSNMETNCENSCSQEQDVNELTINESVDGLHRYLACWPTQRRWSFMSLLVQVLSCHIPFLVSSVEDFKDHIPRETDMKVRYKPQESLAIIVTVSHRRQNNPLCDCRWPWTCTSCRRQQVCPARSTRRWSWLCPHRRAVRRTDWCGIHTHTDTHTPLLLTSVVTDCH